MILFFFKCLPGNLLVVAVYLRKLTTSTKLYMFTMAVGDSVVCVCGIVLNQGRIPGITVLLFVNDLAINVSMFVLVFVAIERLIAVLRPHSFSMRVQRAKTALVGVFAGATSFTVAMNVPRYMGHDMIVRIVRLTVLIASVIIMITCYAAIATALARKALDRRIVGTGSRVQPSSETPTAKTEVQPSVQTTEKPTAQSGIGDAGQSGSLKTAKVSVQQVKTQKNILLPSIITAIFVVGWIPLWLTLVGISLPYGSTRAVIINSVLNPFIYGLVSSTFRDDVRLLYRKTRVTFSSS